MPHRSNLCPRWPLLTAMTMSAAFGAAPARVEEAPPPNPHALRGWQVDAGIAVLAFPRYPGSRSERVLPIPDVAVAYKDLVFASVFEGLGYNAIRARGLRAGPVVKFAFPRNVSDDRQALAGLHSVPVTAEAGGFVEADLDPAVTARLGVRQGLNGHGGLVVDGGLEFHAPPLANERLFIAIGPQFAFYGRKYARAYYGVSAVEATQSPYGVFDPRSGGRVGANASATYLLAPRVNLTTFANYGRLVGDIGRSPIVTGRFGSRDQYAGGLIMTYRFRFGG